MATTATRTDRLDPRSCYRAVQSRDRRFDGVFYTAVHTTGIYCRPSCPARTPAYQHVSFHPSAAAAQSAGFRACKRCLPDATPGSPDWDIAADVAGRAMRLIADGVVDREGVEGLARRVGYTPRHLSRLLGAELGAGPLALARARRAQTARTLLEATSMSCADVAFAAGFSSIRQFNDTVREVYAATPGQLRGRRVAPATTGATGAIGATGAAGTKSTGIAGGASAIGATGLLALRLAVRTPHAGSALLRFLADRAVPGVEASGPGWYARTLDLPHAPGAVRLELPDVAAPGQTAFARATFWLADLRDTTAAVERVRRLLDADCDPVAVAAALAGDRVLGPLVRATPGLRAPGHVDGPELAVRAVLGQQVSVAAARSLAARLAAEHGRPVAFPGLGLDRLFPTSVALAGLDAEALPVPRARGRALIGLCRALADGAVVLDRGPDRERVRGRLLDLPGIGPWTADYIALRALGHPDVFPHGDLGARQALLRLGRAGAGPPDRTDDPTVEPAGNPTMERAGRRGTLTEDPAEGWRPWRSYALLYLWQSLGIPAAMPAAIVSTSEEDRHVDRARLAAR